MLPPPYLDRECKDGSTLRHREQDMLQPERSRPERSPVPEDPLTMLNTLKQPSYDLVTPKVRIESFTASLNKEDQENLRAMQGLIMGGNSS